jgi:hypothetical protein
MSDDGYRAHLTRERLGEALDTIESLQKQITSLQVANGDLKHSRDAALALAEQRGEALRPFASLDLDDLPAEDGEPYADWERFDAEITHGMVRRARAALAAAPPPKGGGDGD